MRVLHAGPVDADFGERHGVDRVLGRGIGGCLTAQVISSGCGFVILSRRVGARARLSA